MIKSGVISVVGIWAVSVSTLFGSDFPTLVAKVPGSANAIMVIDADAILASGIAKKNHWEKRFADGSADRPLYLPPEADKVVVAAQFDIVRGFARTWEVALMGMKEPFSMSLVARAEGGSTDTISGVNVAWLPSDAYFVEVDAQTLGLMAPADRQALARWANNARKPVSGQISPYLKSASGLVSKGTQAVLAIDTADAIQLHRVRARLEQSELAKSLDVEATAQLISQMKGIVLQMRFADKVLADARIDFAAPVMLSETAAKSLVLHAMDSMGMSLPGTEDWKCSVTGNTITMSGELVPESLRRVFSLMELPSTKFSSLKDQPVEESSQDDTAKLSLKYFHSVDTLVTDLKERTKSSNSSDSYWVGRYATKIDRLPILNVDDDLLNYGEKLSETLHIMSGSRRMSNLQGDINARGERSTGGFSGSVDGYGYSAYNYTSPRAAETAAQNATANATAAGTSVKIQGWNLIEEATQEIRRSMTKRYSIEF